MLHIPLLRKGIPYQSLDVRTVSHYRTRETLVEISQANPGLIRRDLLSQETSTHALGELACAQLIEICARASEYFLHESLPLGDALQSPHQYVEHVSATTGLPHVLARRNMDKVCAVLTQMEKVVNGLTRNLDWRILDNGWGEFEGQALSFFPNTHSLGVVLPSNSPGVHSLWVPAIALKTPLVLKPGSAEPWTPYRIAQALIRAGCPREAFSYYPTDHVGAGEILRLCGRSMLFGDASTTGPWQGNARVEIHGPGYSKIVIGEDQIDRWEQYLDVMVTSILDNSGRSCINASGVWVPAHGREIAEALGERLAQVVPRDAEDERAQLAPFADGRFAERISEAINRGLAEGGARDVTAAFRDGPRVTIWQGVTYVLPTVVHCDSPDHPLANREYLFPFASVVEVRPEEIPEKLGPSLVVTAVTRDPRLRRKLLASPRIGRLNLGPVPTTEVRWDQPHEGNLFDLLYARRAFQSAYDISMI